MRVALLHHRPADGPGRIDDWLAWRGLPSQRYPLYRDARLPSLDDFDLLVLLGGPPEATAGAALPWLDAERRLLEASLGAGKRVLGLGFGARLVAEALAAKVRPLGERRIGWWPLQLHEHAQRSPLGRMLPPRLMSLLWQAEGFELPAGAVPLYGAAAWDCLDFVWRERVVALQGHPHGDAAWLEARLAAYADELHGGASVQDAGTLRLGLAGSRGGNSLDRTLDYLSGPHATLR